MSAQGLPPSQNFQEVDCILMDWGGGEEHKPAKTNALLYDASFSHRVHPTKDAWRTRRFYRYHIGTQRSNALCLLFSDAGAFFNFFRPLLFFVVVSGTNQHATPSTARCAFFCRRRDVYIIRTGHTSKPTSEARTVYMTVCVIYVGGKRFGTLHVEKCRI